MGLRFFLLPSPRVSHYGRFRLRRRPIFAAIGARPHLARPPPAERELLLRLATGAHTIVEIGVNEGGSAWTPRQALAPEGHLHLVDPYEPGRLGVASSLLAAQRLLATVPRGTVSWHQTTSHVGARDWAQPIDFLFIDGDHSYEAVALDWSDWSPFVTPAGVVVFHNARVTRENPRCPGVVRLVEEIATAGGPWRAIEEEGSMVAFARVPGGAAPPARSGDGVEPSKRGAATPCRF